MRRVPAADVTAPAGPDHPPRAPAPPAAALAAPLLPPPPCPPERSSFAGFVSKLLSSGAPLAPLLFHPSTCPWPLSSFPCTPWTFWQVPVPGSRGEVRGCRAPPRGPLRPASGVGGDRALAPQHPYPPGSGVQLLGGRGSRASQRPAFAGSWKAEDAPGRAGWRRGRCCSKQREREGLSPISSHGFLWSLLGSPWSDMKGRGKGVRVSCGRDRNGELSLQ